MDQTIEALEKLEEQKSLLTELLDTIQWQEIAWSVIITLLQIVFALIIFLIIKRVGRYVIEKIFTRYMNKRNTVPNRLNTLYKLSKNIFNAVIYFFLVYTILELLGFQVAPLIASAGVLGLALSLGAQGFVSDIVNGFMILLEKQMDVGDVVRISDVTGTVEDVNLKTTKIKDFDGTTHFIPNRAITIVSNQSRSDMRVLIQIRLYPSTDLEDVRKALENVNREAILNFEEITIEPSEISFVPVGPGQLAAQVIMYTKAGTQYGMRNTFYEKYVNALRESGIDLPNTTLELPNA
ncbi:mechanosensitive ion channel family protein [Alkalibacterium sp. f15]|uniref:mechanosensitive ion channel family protein n=1 Tax=Alkalibacterium sp. f15 TaxID=3414029 RepID=UPI003BF80E2D